jgi:hypothetical protein
MTGHAVKLSLCFVALLLCPAIASTQTMTNMASKTGGASPQISPGRARTYYIAADDVTWDYVPGGIDIITGKPFQSVGRFQVAAGKVVERPVPTGTYPYLVTFSINGFAHGTMPLRAITMRKGEHVRWYLFIGVNDFDAHSPHWHGNTVVVNQCAPT